MDHLDTLESQSIYLLREAHYAFPKLCMLWSMGKDSNILLWLSKKAFLGTIPYPLLHIDTTYEFPEMLAFREWAKDFYQFDLIVKINEEARAGCGAYTTPIGYETHDPVTVTHELKTVALKQFMKDRSFHGLITGIRRDEDGTRAKERYFSPRSEAFEWDYKDQPPEFWNQFVGEIIPEEHIRIQPLLDWSERDIWRYIEREKIPIPSLYFAREGKRYRSLGCWPITKPIESQATTIAEIIEELEHATVSERSGRAQDHHEPHAMQNLRAKGFL
ncbi:MAG: sulfate adenylyltransferase [Verrucomicrobia bacterium RIFCSPHIGHO2_12_FULL_41_10]|nr:MAG: sulfate adenylyltransferase [Verrucomicrobia bacterium RIFCSPHIGHO2_12_FULL_41_10]HLB33074.1 sulfate adenylyltransferase subunit CysD [Chthoniobacterales bacterium]